MEADETSGDFPPHGPASHVLGGFVSRRGLPRLPAPLGAPMEALIEIVAASFARNGIECPATPRQVEKRPIRVGTAAPERNSAPTELAALPDHNYRKISP
jgi:hypothetical protein